MKNPYQKMMEMNADYKKTLKHGKDIRKPEYVSTGLLKMDHLTGGGIPLGRTVHLYGTKGAGKTTMAMHIAKEFNNVKKSVLFVDTEGTYPQYLAETLGIHDIHVVEPANGEAAVTAILEGLDSGFDLVILDSVGSTRPMATKVDGSNIGTNALLMTKLTGLATAKLKENNSTLLLLNHEKKAIGGFTNEVYTPGGVSIEYASSLSIRLHAMGKTKGHKYDKETGKVIYKTTTVKIVKNKLKAIHENEYDIYLDTFARFSPYVDMINFGVELGLITMNKRTYMYGDHSLGAKHQDISEKLSHDPELTAMIVDEIRALMEIDNKKDYLIFGDDVEGYNAMVTTYNEKYGGELELSKFKGLDILEKEKEIKMKEAQKVKDKGYETLKLLKDANNISDSKGTRMRKNGEIIQKDDELFYIVSK